MKKQIREEMKERRRAFKGAERERADEEILKNFFALLGDYNVFFIYNSFNFEADTKKITNALLAADKSVYLPRVKGEKMEAVKYGRTVKGAFGVEEPVGQAYSGDIEVTVIPLLAVNENGYRIGYGGGYYDKFLKSSSSLRVGLGYGFQRAQFTADEWDEPLDYFICEEGVLEYKNFRR